MKIFILSFLLTLSLGLTADVPIGPDYIDQGKIETRADFIRISCALEKNHELVASPNGNKEIFVFVKKKGFVYMKDFSYVDGKQVIKLIKSHDCRII